MLILWMVRRRSRLRPYRHGVPNGTIHVAPLELTAS